MITYKLEDNVVTHFPAIFKGLGSKPSVVHMALDVELVMRNINHLSDEQLRASLYWPLKTDGVRRVVARMRRDRLNVFRGSPNPNNGPH